MIVLLRQSEYQFGFRVNHITTITLTEIVDRTRNVLDDGNYVICISLDLTKAFDTVLEQLQHYDVTSVTMKLIKSYLQFIEFNGEYSLKQLVAECPMAQSRDTFSSLFTQT